MRQTTQEKSHLLAGVKYNLLPYLKKMDSLKGFSNVLLSCLLSGKSTLLYYLITQNKFKSRHLNISLISSVIAGTVSIFCSTNPPHLLLDSNLSHQFTTLLMFL